MKAESAYPKAYLYARIVQAKLYIDNHFSENIDLNNISSQANFSKFHFIRLFKKAYGKSPHQYLIKVRLDHARKMLKAGHRVSHVCYTLGFESITSFTALFKKSSALTPAVFQQKQFLLEKDQHQKPLHYIPACFAFKYGWLQKSNFEEVI